MALLPGVPSAGGGLGLNGSILNTVAIREYINLMSNSSTVYADILRCTQKML